MKIPSHAKEVFQGIWFDVYHWQQEMYDGSSQTFEMVKRKPSVGVIAVIKDKILVLEQEQPLKPKYFALPGGRVEPGQSHLQAAEEELLQETGYKSSEIKLLHESFGGTKMYSHQSVFLAKKCKKNTEQNLDAGEKIKVRFIDFDKFLQLCREESFAVPLGFRFLMYEALIDGQKRSKLKSDIFGE